MTDIDYLIREFDAQIELDLRQLENKVENIIQEYTSANNKHKGIVKKSVELIIDKILKEDWNEQQKERVLLLKSKINNL
ncbi:MAG TPA: hypothetical protein GX530_06935 [Corynebacteriales bacterium]|nr:hypothetical protein [Mycobacteriales bacterium]